MEHILEKLYSAFERTDLSPKEKIVLERNEPVMETAMNRLTPGEFEELWSAFSDQCAADNEASFAQGFRLGVQLTLAGLEPI